MFRIVTINLEQNHKRWTERHKLISAELAALKPDIIAFNEVCIPIQSAKTLRDAVTAATGISYNLVQQTKVNGLSEVEGEALLSRYPVIETGSLDYQTRDMVADAAASIVCGDFNATLDKPSAALMASRFRPSQTTDPTAFTALADAGGAVSHPYWPRMDRCID